jgi:NDP-sugar pyrophosphorylase family protein
VWIHKTAVISESADISGPLIVCAGAQLRHSCYIRGSAVIGEKCVVGNSTEVKNAIMFDGAQAPHFNYVGDSILGSYAHIGAGVILSNLRLDKKNITILFGNERIETGLRKFGAVIGDHAEIGCNSVLNPGSVICKNAAVMPVSNIRGYYCDKINKI